MNNQQLQLLTVKELQKKALDLKIALSFTENGKRHRLNKPELIAAILEVSKVKKIKNSSTYGELSNSSLIEQEESNVNFKSMNPFSIMNHFKDLTLNALIKSNSNKEIAIAELENVKNQLELSLLENSHNLNHKSNKLLVRQWSNTINRIKFLIKDTELKINKMGVC